MGNSSTLEGWAQIAEVLYCSIRTAKRHRCELMSAGIVKVGLRGRPPKRRVWAEAEDLREWQAKRAVEGKKN